MFFLYNIIMPSTQDIFHRTPPTATIKNANVSCHKITKHFKEKTQSPKK